MDDSVAEIEHRQQHGKNEIVETEWIIKIDQTAEGTAVGGHPVISSEFLEADAEKIDHLSKCQGDHDEIDSAGPQTHHPDHQGKSSTDQQGHGKLDESVVNSVITKDPNGISADSQINRMSETDHSPETENQVKTHGGQGKDHDPAEHLGIKNRHF